MASIKDLRKRISTVKNTQQTTKAMKMVSAAKLRRAQEAITTQRPYAKQLAGLIQKLAAEPQLESSSPFFSRPESAESGDRVLVLVATSDRGLCGSFNSSIIKAATKWAVENRSRYSDVEFCYVGKRGFDFFKTKEIAKIGRYFSECGGKVSFKKAKILADALVADFLAGKYTEIKIIYNEFKNAVSQTVIVEDYLPLTKAKAAQVDTKVAETEATKEYIIKPSGVELLNALIAKTFADQTYRVLLETQAGEHGARMSAMENATKNAGEMIGLLTLQYNKQRQASITKELLEIISGTESQKASS